MPTKAKGGVDVLLPSIRDVLGGAQAFEHVKLFSKPNEKDDKDGFVFVRGHEGASEADSGDGYVVSVSNQVEGESVSRDCLLSSQGLGIHGRHRGLMSMRVRCLGVPVEEMVQLSARGARPDNVSMSARVISHLPSVSSCLPLRPCQDAEDCTALSLCDHDVEEDNGNEVEVMLAWDDQVNTVKVRGILFV